MQEQILKIHSKDKNSLGTVRCLPNLKAAAQEDWIWLRGIAVREKMDIQLQQLPAQQTFRMDEKERLFPLGKVTPVGHLPRLNWQTLPQFLPIDIPVAALPAQVPEKQVLRLAKAKKEQKSAALLTDMTAWKDYANSASRIRLQCLKFAASAQGKVLIWGSPLPAIPGQSYWLKHQLFLPNGWDIDPPILSSVLARKMDLKDNAVLLFGVDGTWQRIDLDSFVVASRGAIRRTVLAVGT